MKTDKINVKLNKRIFYKSRKMKPNYLLIDSTNLFKRLYAALKPYEHEQNSGKNLIRNIKVTENGQTIRKDLNVMAVHYYFRTMVNLKREYPDASFVHIFDSVTSNEYRRQIDPEYKANRKSHDVEQEQCIEALKGALKVLQGVVYDEPNFEADDVIATIASKIAQANKTVGIVSNDKDLAQVVAYAPDSIRLLQPEYDQDKGRNVYKELDSDLIKEKYGVYPEQVFEYLAIKGDKADNVSGIKGLGDKKAIEILTNFGSIAKAIEYVMTIEKNKKDRLEPNFSGEILERDDNKMSLYVYNILNSPDIVKEAMKQIQLVSTHSELQLPSFKQKLEEVAHLNNEQYQKYARDTFNISNDVNNNFTLKSTATNDNSRKI